MTLPRLLSDDDVEPIGPGAFAYQAVIRRLADVQTVGAFTEAYKFGAAMSGEEEFPLMQPYAVWAQSFDAWGKVRVAAVDVDGPVAMPMPGGDGGRE